MTRFATTNRSLWWGEWVWLVRRNRQLLRGFLTKLTRFKAVVTVLITAYILNLFNYSKDCAQDTPTFPTTYSTQLFDCEIKKNSV